MSRFKAVIFDLDGVITDTAHYHFLAWKALADSLGIAFDAEANEHLKGIDRMGSLELILGEQAARYTAQDKLAMADAKNVHYQQLVASMTPADLLPGALDALAEVRAAGLKTGLASVSKNAFAVLERLGIRDCFDDVVDAATIARGKPDPEIFLTAARHLGVAPADCPGQRRPEQDGGGTRRARQGEAPAADRLGGRRLAVGVEIPLQP
ncbi:MAG: beta-phosphoglucomutase, partial [Pseudomonadota bacterium]